MRVRAVRVCALSPETTGMPACSTQLCAILALLDKGRAGDDQDFALYLASAVNNSESLVAAERSQRRCRRSGHSGGRLQRHLAGRQCLDGR